MAVVVKRKEKPVASMYFDMWRHLKNKMDRGNSPGCIGNRMPSQCVCDDCRQRRQLAAKLALPHVGEIDPNNVRLKKEFVEN
jgi:hypothetical protein